MNKVGNDGLTPLLLVAKQGDLQMTQLLLRAAADKDKTNTEGSTPLLLACLGGNLEACFLKPFGLRSFCLLHDFFLDF